MNTRLPKLLATGLFVLMGGLFVAAFVLNRSHYSASVLSVEASFSSVLEEEAKKLRQDIESQEEQRFSKYRSPGVLDADLFLVQPGSVVPVCTAGVLEAVVRQEADQAFKQGIEKLPSPDALPFFRTAAKRPVDTPNDLYKKVGALFNMLELKHEVQTVCCILTLLDHPNVSLTESQKQFFRELLDEQVPNLEKVKKRLAELRQTAEVIDHKLKRKSGAYRVAIADKTLSVREDGLALLYSPEIQTSPSVLLANSSPPGMHAEIIPELFIFIPDAEIDKAKQTIHQQYRTGNMILALMVVLGGVLGGGIFIAVHRQRELDAMKTNFIATVSHELRTPLSLIRLHAETLHHGRVSEDKVHDYHQTILTESERLSGIVNNVLDFSRIERNKLQLHIESTDISALCKQIAESFRFRLEKDGFELEKQIQPGIVVPADPLAVSQILFNLMDNAIKYSDGEKSIRLELERSGDQAILRVADRGIGIPDKLKKHIFDEFVRSNDSKASARRGSGIGLSVARRLAEEMGASIEVVDNKPTGTIFTVSLAGGSTNEAAIS